MKKSIYVLTLLILLLGMSGCNVSPAEEAESTYSESTVEERQIELPTIPGVLEPTETETSAIKPGLHIYEIRARLHENMPEYRFVATGMQGEDEWHGYVMGLNVYDEKGQSILSEDFSENIYGKVVGYYVFNEMMDTMGLHVTDVNFDGYKDVIILNMFGGAHGNTWYDCWLWDTEISSFVKSKSFSDICNPALDREKKCIYSAGGSSASYWGGRIYKYIDGEFVVTNELDTDWDRLVEKVLIGGKLEIIREISFDGDNKIIEREQEYYKNSELWQLDHPRWYWIGGHHADQWLD